jgi:pyruvate formate lyase activating enzyme
MLTNPTRVRTATRESWRPSGGDTLPRRGVMKICGFQGVSLIDYPGRIASVLFLGGCNFRCPFCQNPDLVLRAESMPDFDLDDVLRAVLRRKGLLDGVVVTGGEPLISSGALFELFRVLRQSGLAVKLDTNGYEVETLHEVLGRGLVDYVAMDVKTSPEKYAAAVGRVLDVGRILESIAAISGSGIEHEFRTTCVPGLVDESDIITIGTLLGPRQRYVVQQFRATSDLIEPAFVSVQPYSSGVIRSFAEAVSPLVGSVTTRGL